jgi:hypothetical protein
MTFRISMELEAIKEKFVLYKGDYKEKISNVYVRKTAFRSAEAFPQFITVTLSTGEQSEESK